MLLIDAKKSTSFVVSCSNIIVDISGQLLVSGVFGLLFT